MSDPLRFFVPPESLIDETVILRGEVFHHLRTVLRSKPGAELTLLDGHGQCCLVSLTVLHKQEAEARVIRRWQQNERGVPITLIQALPKGDKFDLVLQKGTELGITVFQPVETRHAVLTLQGERRDKRMQRWQKIIREAARQSRRSRLPEIRPLTSLSETLGESTHDLKLVLWEAGARPLAEALPKTPPDGVRLLVGPEGGFSDEEIREMTQAGFQAVHLGPRILRTETAGLAATPILQYLYGDWHQAPSDSNPNQHEE